MSELTTNTTQLSTTSHPSGIVPTANVDVVDWIEILSHETVLAQGVLDGKASRGDTLFTYPVSPLSLKSATHKSILMHLSELFSQWHGTIRFKLILTLPYFVATKIVFAYAPNPIKMENLSVGSLAGLQNSVILNPTNNTEVVLQVPFVSVNNWATTNGNTGSITAALLEPIVSSLELSGGLPWTLMVAGDPSTFRFRYIVPPPLPDLQSGGSNPLSGPTLGDSTLAQSMSTSSGYVSGARSRNNWPLVQQPQASLAMRYESMLLIPRSRVEYVMQKVRGQFPAAPDGSTDQISNMFDVPGFTLSEYRPFNLPHPSVLYPYITQSCLSTVYHTWQPDGNYPSPVCLSRLADASNIWLQVPENAFNLLETVRPSMYITVVFGSSPSNNLQFTTPALYTYTGNLAANGKFYHGFTTGVVINWEHQPITCILASWEKLSQRTDYILDALRQVDSCPSQITHMALYTTMPPELAGTFGKWLTTADNTSPPAECLHYSISFSPNQSQLAYNAGRFSDGASSRGIVWKLFKLFKGDETKWWAWLVKGLDVIVDALIGAFLGRADVPYVVPISQSSGFRVEAVGDYDPDIVSQYQERVQLEYIPQAKTTSLTRFYLSQQNTQPRGKSRSLSRHYTRKSKSPQHQAAHPSPSKTKFFRNHISRASVSK